jgi:hypothetical protein
MGVETNDTPNGRREMTTAQQMNTARKAVRTCAKEFGRDFSRCHRVAIDSLIANGMADNIATEMGWNAVKDALLGI